MKLFLLFLFSLSLYSCSSSEKKIDTAVPNTASAGKDLNASPVKALEVHGEIKLVQNDQVQKWLNYYQRNGRKHMVKYLERASMYSKLIGKRLEKEALPAELAYLPIIESGFSPTAHSHAGAVGYWQFIRSTGKIYGLKVSDLVDERRDIFLSTDAAIKYLKSLYLQFGDWYLALSAYNAGGGRIRRLIRRYKTRDFFKLSKQRRMPRETKNYVPKFLAAAHIASNPEKYGFKKIEPVDYIDFDEIYVNTPISLLKLSEQIKVPFKELKVLNSRYRSDFVPIYRKGQKSVVRVPKGQESNAIQALALSRSDRPVKFERDFFYYKIRRGDNLSRIAHKHRVRMSSILAMNNIGRRTLLRIGRILRIPENRAKYSKRAVKKHTKLSNSVVHKVKPGESLGVIAEKYGLGLSVLMRRNKLSRRSTIRVGQKLIIRPKESKVKVAQDALGSKKVHIVAQGETLIGIARRYKLSLSQLLSMNKLAKKSKLFVGRKLVVAE